MAFDERVVFGSPLEEEVHLLVRLQQFVEHRLVISAVERDVAVKIRKQLHLLGISSPIEDGSSASPLRLHSRVGQRCGPVRAPNGTPKVHSGRFDVGLLQSNVVAQLIPVIGGVRIACVNANASGFIRNLTPLDRSSSRCRSNRPAKLNLTKPMTRRSCQTPRGFT